MNQFPTEPIENTKIDWTLQYVFSQIMYFLMLGFRIRLWSTVGFLSASFVTQYFQIDPFDPIWGKFVYLLFMGFFLFPAFYFINKSKENLLFIIFAFPSFALTMYFANNFGIFKAI